MTDPTDFSTRMNRRTQLMLTLSAAAFLAVLVPFMRLSTGLPTLPGDPVVKGPGRGRLISGDGQVLASGPARARTYPLGQLAAQVIGFTGDAGGLEGLERALNGPLSTGQDQVLSLDTRMQAATERALATAGQRANAQYGAAVVLERRSGAVLAMANWPHFDPNVWRAASPAVWRNRAGVDEFEPGSVIKALTVAALMNEGRTDRARTYPAPMRRRYAGTVINDVVPHPEVLSTWQILRYSSNVGMTELVDGVPADVLDAYFRAYGFGEGIALRLPNADGVLPPVTDWTRLRQATMAFGQGMSVSAVQLAAAFNVLANDGEYVSPSLLRGAPPSRRQVLRPDTAREMQDMLHGVVDEGIQRNAELPGYHTAGKTGTAQVALGGRYSTSVYTSTFAGFFPAAAPQYTVVVMVRGAKEQYQGSQLAAPIFREITADVASFQAWAPEQRPAATPTRRPALLTHHETPSRR